MKLYFVQTEAHADPPAELVQLKELRCDGEVLSKQFEALWTINQPGTPHFDLLCGLENFLHEMLMALPHDGDRVVVLRVPPEGEVRPNGPG